jgi:PAS domain S-box-containing protein
MKSLKLAWRAPLLIAFPLICQALFVVALISMLTGAQMCIERASNMQEVLFRMNELVVSICDAISYVVDTPGAETKARAARKAAIVGIESIVDKLPAGDKTLLKKEMKTIQNIFKYSVEVKAINQAEKADIRHNIYGMSLHSLPPFLRELNKITILNNEVRHNEFQKSIEIKDRILRYAYGAIAASFLIGVAMYFFFTIGIKKPIQHIAENSRRLSSDKPLLPQLQGDDEFSKLDRGLHQTRNAVQAAAKRESALINNVSDLVCSLSADGTFIEVNAAAIRILRISAKELVGQNIADIVIPTQSLLADEYVRKACKQDNIFNFELSLQPQMVSEIETHWSCIWSPLSNRLFCVVRDITEEKALSRMKQDFVDMVSHDLRSPLTSLGISLEMIERGGLGEINENALKELQSTNRNVQVLINFINDLLDFQKLDEGKVQLERTHCNINSIIKEAISLVRETARSKQIEIEYSPTDYEVFCDQVKLTQTILNLLTNAIKFGPSESSVQVKVEEFEKSGDSDENRTSWMRVLVSDRGPGVPEDMRQRIFEPFEQAESHRHQGTGLGLAICKMIVEAHGGKIGVKENSGVVGSTFWFEILTSDLA